MSWVIAITRRVPSAAIIFRGFLTPKGRLVKQQRAYFDIWVALHDLLDPGQWEGRVTVIWGILLCSVDLPPPKRREEFREGLAWLNEWLLLLAHVTNPFDVRPRSGYKWNQTPWEFRSLAS